MNMSEDLPILAVFFEHKDRGHEGSGVLFRHGELLYVLTASHVVHGTNCEHYEPSNINSFKIVSERFGELTLKKEILNEKYQRQYDISVFEVEVSEGNLESIPHVNLSDESDFPGVKLAFRGKSNAPSKKAYTIRECDVDSKTGGIITVGFPARFYTDYKGATGAELLQGYSGSGVFVVGQNITEIYLVGVVTSVDDDDYSGVSCCCISRVQCFMPDGFELSPFKERNKVLETSIRDIRKQVTQNVIEERKASDNVSVTRLNDKMNVFLGSWELEELDQYIEDMVTWENLYYNNVKNDEDIKLVIDNSRKELSSGSKKFRVKSTLDAHNKYRDIEREFKEIVDMHLEEFPQWRKYKRTIVNGEIAKMLAQCKLDFILL